MKNNYLKNKLATLSIIFYFISFLCFVYLLIDKAFAERIRFYDTSDGWPKPTYEYADKQSDGSYRVYDLKGRYKGKVTKDRFYNRKGQVEQKYYLFTK